MNSYTESGFTVSGVSGSWFVRTDYGSPGPFIEMYGRAVAGTLQVTAGGAAFSFKSVDIYSSLTSIPYSITGLRNGAPVFTLDSTHSNTFGDFATVVNPQAPSVIDTLRISLTDSEGAMGVDNIVVSR